MIWLTEEDRRLLVEIGAKISKERIRESWGRFMEHPSIHFGNQEGGIILFQG
jgi:hypothetical protein